MKTENYSKETIERYTRDLETLLKRGAILENQQSVKETIARQNWSNGTKQTVTNAVKLDWKHNGIEAILPKYKPEVKIPLIPNRGRIRPANKRMQTPISDVSTSAQGDSSKIRRSVYAEMDRLQHRELNTIDNARKSKRAKTPKDMHKTSNHVEHHTENVEQNF